MRLDETGEVTWARAIRSTGDGRCNSIAVDDNGVFVGGVLAGEVNYDELVMGTNDLGHAFVARIQHDGVPDWFHTFGNEGFTGITSLDLTRDGLVATGRLKKTVSFLGTTLGGLDGDSVSTFVFSMDLGGESIHWAEAISTTGDVNPEQLVVDHRDDVHVVGYFSGSGTFGDRPVAADGDDAFYLRISATGGVQLSFIFASDGRIAAHAVAIGSTGEVAIGLEFLRELRAEGAARTDAVGMKDGAIARLSPAGDLSALHTLGSTGDDIIWGVAFDGRDIIALGQAGPNATIDGVLDLGPGAGSTDIFVGRFGFGP